MDLEISSTPSNIPMINKYKSNSAGRPEKSKEIKFNQPPKSIISLLLSSEKTKQDCLTNIQEACSKNLGDIPNLAVEKTQNKIDLEVHVDPHNKVRRCSHANCTYTTNSSSNLIKHIRIHTSEKPYACDKCVFRTNFQNSLKVHQRIHTLERPYVCKVCNYRCNSSSNLKKHCKHRHSKEKK